jgi:hypothetical protein
MNSPQLLAEKIVGPNLQNEAGTHTEDHRSAFLPSQV